MSYTNTISSLQSNLTTQASNRPDPTPDHRTAVTTGGASGLQPAAANSADQASLSRAGKLISQALSLPDVRTAKVVSIQQALAAGTYGVTSSDLAGKLLQTLLS